MIYIISKSNKPQYNIALEEYCFKKLLNHEKVFMLWINEPTIVVGKHQNTLVFDYQMDRQSLQIWSFDLLS